MAKKLLIVMANSDPRNGEELGARLHACTKNCGNPGILSGQQFGSHSAGSASSNRSDQAPLHRGQWFTCGGIKQEHQCMYQRELSLGIILMDGDYLDRERS